VPGNNAGTIVLESQEGKRGFWIGVSRLRIEKKRYNRNKKGGFDYAKMGISLAP
jgi:hypothetical protein